MGPEHSDGDIRQVAAHLQINKSMARYRAKKGDLPGIKIEHNRLTVGVIDYLSCWYHSFYRPAYRSMAMLVILVYG